MDAGIAAGGIDQGRDHPAMEDPAPVQMLGLDLEHDLGMIGAPDQEAVVEELGEALGRFEGRGKAGHERVRACRIGPELSTVPVHGGRRLDSFRCRD